MTGLYLHRRPAGADPEGRPLAWRCASAKRALWAYLDRELCDADVGDLEAHLTICPSCALEYSSRRALKRSLARARTSALGAVARRRLVARITDQLGAHGCSVPSDIPSVTVRPAPGR
ncbi:MAG: anti-sigma factor family protein [Gemmatimonadota bacterium]|jgi:anti-sigma factor RsiW|nr:zf-HC2 domain-containing protein [Gemmatimonadota bacterium]